MNQWLLGLGALAVGGAAGAGVCTYLGQGAEIVDPSVATGTVFDDADGDGVQDDGEAGMAGVSVLLETDSTTVRVLTGPTGTWRVEMPIDRFTVAVDTDTLPFPAQLTTARRAYNLNVPPGFIAPNVNWGYQEIEPGVVTGIVYEDTNNNGTQDDGETGLSGVTITATEEDTGAVTTLTTGPDGTYRFEANGPVNHLLAVDTTTLPFNAQLTTARQAYNLNVPPRFIAPNVNWGYQEIEPGVVTGIVYEDTNNNGTQDDGETGLSGVTITATEEDTGAVTTLTTGPDGTYRFEANGPVNHLLAVDTTTLPFNAQLTTARQAYNLNVPPRFIAPNVNWGYQEIEPGVVTGIVYEDTNNNGTQDDGETGLSGVTITATEEDTGAVTTLTTGPDGTYRFEANGPVNHLLAVDTTTLPFNAQLTTARQAYNLNVPPRFTAPNVNWGYQPVEPGVASGVVFDDVDGNGVQDGGEPGLAGAEVVLAAQDLSRTVIRATTDENGVWTHRGAIGMAVISVDTSTLPTRDGSIPAQTSDPSTYALDVTATTDRRDLHFGFTWIASTGGGVAAPPPGGAGTGDGDPSSSDEPSPPPPSPTASSGPDECSLLGTWDLRDQAFLDQVAATAGAGAPGFTGVDYVSGAHTVTMREDGSYTAVRDQWSFRISTTDGALVVAIDATDPGTWSATDDTLSISDPGGAPADVQVSIEQGGQLVPLPAPPQGTVASDAINGSGPYTCVGDVLTVDLEGVTSIFDRVG